jgi:glycosyltransferase involved in cell wall biosynthesis
MLLPNIHDLPAACAPLAGRRDLMFLGAFTHEPNGDAMHGFVRDVLPALRRAVPGLGLRIVGADPTPAVLELASDHVVVTGYVDDLAAEFARARVFVAPLRFGAGIKGKLLLSLAHGLPAVASPIGAEGIPLVDGRDAYVAQTVDDWVRAVTRLVRDDAAWQAMADAGRAVLRDHYSFDAAGRHVDALLATLRDARASRTPA